MLTHAHTHTYINKPFRVSTLLPHQLTAYSVISKLYTEVALRTKDHYVSVGYTCVKCVDSVSINACVCSVRVFCKRVCVYARLRA